MIIRNHDENEKKAEILPKRIHGDWIVDKNSGSFKLFAEGGPKDVPENCQNWHCYDAIQFGEMPGSHPFFPWGVFRQFNREGPTQFRERMISFDYDEPGDTLVEGTFLHTQIDARVLSYEVNTRSKMLSIWLIQDIEVNDSIETNDLGPTEKLDPPPVPVNAAMDLAAFEEAVQEVDPELIPPFIVNHQGWTLLAKQVSGWEICGEHALVFNIKGSWYWRDIQTGRVDRLPQEIDEMVPVHCSRSGFDIFLKRKVGHGMFLYRLREHRMMQIAQKGLNLNWSSDGKKLAMVWTGSSHSLDEQFWFEQPWVSLPEKLGYHPVLLSPSRLQYLLSEAITELDRNRFQWIPGDRYLLGKNCFPQGDLIPTRENNENFIPPLGLWDTGEKGESPSGCKDWPVPDQVDLGNSLFLTDNIFTLHDGIVISDRDFEVRSKHYFCKEWRSCTVLWNGIFYGELIQNGMEFWSRTDNQIGKVDWETGKIVCRVDADSKARFLDGRLIRTVGDEVWLEKVDCR
ncbi:MAG: hypothetical protein HQL85_19450 [Magnetococcales bacterium]|nr:hypothetical protein [Magnetococcales bacterium]